MDASKAYMRVAYERNSSWNEATKQAVYDYVYCIVVSRLKPLVQRWQKSATKKYEC